jgi:hypothetical protein
VDLLAQLLDGALGPAGITAVVPARSLARTLLALDVGTVLEDAAGPAPIELADRMVVTRSLFDRTDRSHRTDLAGDV